ncbi:3-oxo-tetronate 4-phosphate decarboxylase [Nitratireductor sp. XY-223]|uniref:3-oxo-tetronate 4-phosphate decarboxylase n=1 Tax=Nitratireductor sp. XY-223 TaxID=2561926 RepID=UPI0010A9B1E8|nr:3-oxo-tetronate 4-phosphate decarboxylase [Nitratireductor sp. XY-223]
MTETRLRETICDFARSLYDRGLAHGSTGNISARTDDGGLLVTPTGSSFGRLDPARLSRFDQNGTLIGGDRPTKEMPLHAAFYDTRGTRSGAVVHLHSHHAVALSMLPETDHDDALPPYTPYSIMQLGRVKVLPYFQPGDPAMGEAVRELDGQRSAVILANHGPVVTAATLESAVYAMEELEETARLAITLSNRSVNKLSADQVRNLIKAFDID